MTTPPPPPPPPSPYSERVAVTERTVTVAARSWSPAQLVAGAFGIFLGVLAGLVLARSGFSDLTGETVTVWGFGHTALMGIIEAALALVFLLSAFSPMGARSTLVTLGLLMLGFGIFVILEPDRLTGTLGTNSSLRWLFVGLGAASIFSGFAFPIIGGRRVERAVVA